VSVAVAWQAMRTMPIYLLSIDKFFAAIIGKASSSTDGKPTAVWTLSDL
jgi:hypothetical protein